MMFIALSSRGRVFEAFTGFRRRLVAASVCTLTVVCSSAAARTIYVPSEHPTIQRAIDRSESGDTVLVAPGIYEENLNFYGKSLYLSSTQGFDSTFLRALLPQVPAIMLISREDSTTTIRGFTITAEHSVGSCAILCQGTSPAIIYNRIVANLTAGTGSAGIDLKGPICRPLIRGNIFDQNGGSAISGTGVESASIDSNAFLRNTAQVGAVMHFTQSAGLRINRNLIHGNVCYTRSALWFDRVDGIAIDHNTIIQNNSGDAGTLTFRSCGNVSITSSILAFDLGQHTIDWEGEGLPTVTGNCLHGQNSTPCLGFDPDSTSNVFSDPLLCAIKDFDFSLASNSPCVGAGADGHDMGFSSGIGCEERAPVPLLPEPGDFSVVEEMPVEIHHSMPRYPDEAVSVGASGTVWVQAFVDSKGIVVDARILKPSGSNYGFEESALQAAYKNRYSPAIQKGKPVAVWVSYKVDFNFRR